MPEAMPTEEEWQEWITHPCTKRLRYWANHEIERLKDAWANGEFSGAFTTEMLVKNAAATGACSIYAEVIELNYEKVIIGASDEGETEQNGANPGGTGSTG